MANARAGEPSGVTGTDSVAFVSKGANGLAQGELGIRYPDGSVQGMRAGHKDRKLKAIGPPLFFDGDNAAEIPF
ncbi:MAG: hypothetical protein ABEK29_09565, partial [Bradymonadaceae bacterium]